MSKEIDALSQPLLADIKRLIDEARSRVATKINVELTMLYWRIGGRINTEILGGGRAEYGKLIISGLSKQLTQDYGRTFGEKNLRRMMQFAKVYPDEEIVVSLIRQLSWSHILAILPMVDAIKRDFYAEICCLENWSVRQLRERIRSMLYERSAISKKPEETIANDLQALRQKHKVSPDFLLKDPYVLDFLGFDDRYIEKNLEDAILREMERFLLEAWSRLYFCGAVKATAD